jgi:hypothetical protein
MKMTRSASLALTAVVCLIAEGALVAGFAFGLGSLRYAEFGHSVPPERGCIPAVDHHC